MSHKFNKSHEPLWCDWPNRKYGLEVHDLTLMAIRCDAWRAFFSSETAVALQRLKGHVIYFSQYQAFDKLICEFRCSEKQLARTIRKMFHPSLEFDGKPARESNWTPIFRRKDIYDARTWTNIPLTWFVPVSEWKPPTEDEHWRNLTQVLAAKETPTLQLSIELPWVVQRKCFTLRRRSKDRKLLWVMTFAHPDIDPRFGNRRWVAEAFADEFPPEATKMDVFEELLAEVRQQCAKHLVTIED